MVGFEGLTDMRLQEVDTPALILDRQVLETNLSRMKEAVSARGTDLRPHLKTAKCVEIARMATCGHSGAITVSTLREAAYFIQHGFTDITLAAPIVPDKLHAVARLQERGARVHVLTDDLHVARAITERARMGVGPFSVFVEIDCGYGRSGLKPNDDTIVEIGRLLHDCPEVHLHGVLTHAGHSYNLNDADATRAIADEEALSVVTAAGRLRDTGIPCPVVSTGSTPTSVVGRSVQGVDEERPGNYMFYDLSMVGRGVSTIDKIAVSVLSSVIVSQPDKVRIDAGALALSKDRGADEGPMPGVGYGIVRDIHNRAEFADAVVRSVSQEQGWLDSRGDGKLSVDAFPIGHRVRVLPNHSCLTSAAYDRYYVVDGGDEIVGEWPRVNGW